ncbi:uncharacterized protein LOC126757419 [Bactrocera neohumeralis]|uniref:uncharacterized protein LOC126757419 n=1 Tax=Bactrocera neohumeralis TaxID=98809 RepID=UPI0021666C37|nr:uncharacterized protein LOC126757419 [Bactrocera neohumeralis]
MKATLALIAVLLVLQNRSVSAKLNVSEIISDLFQATFNPSEFSLPAVTSKPLSAREACANELNSSVRTDIAEAGAEFRQILGILQTDADDFENLSQLEKDFVANINKCDAQKESYGCYILAIEKVVREVGAIPVDNVRIFFSLVKLFKSIDGEYAKFIVCLVRHPEVISPPGSSEAEQTTASSSILPQIL